MFSLPAEDRTFAGGRIEFKPIWGPWPSFSPARMGCRKPCQHQQGLLFYFLFRLSIQMRKRNAKRQNGFLRGPYK